MCQKIGHLSFNCPEKEVAAKEGTDKEVKSDPKPTPTGKQPFGDMVATLCQLPTVYYLLHITTFSFAVLYQNICSYHSKSIIFISSCSM